MTLAWAIFAPDLAASDAEIPSISSNAEVLHYKWETHGLLKILFPQSGTATLKVERPQNGSIRAELRVDTPDEAYWLTGASIDEKLLTVKEVWSSYRWRGRTKNRHKLVDEQAAVDMIATILSLRRDRPESPRRFSFLAGSKIYPVVAQADKVDGKIAYHIEGVKEPGGNRWNDRAEITIANDSRHTPEHVALIGTFLRIDLTVRGDSDGVTDK